MNVVVVPGSARKNYWQRRVENDRLIAAAREMGIGLVIEDRTFVRAGYESLVNLMVAMLVAVRGQIT